MIARKAPTQKMTADATESDLAKIVAAPVQSIIAGGPETMIKQATIRP
jgi:hypothetical protein